VFLWMFGVLFSNDSLESYLICKVSFCEAEIAHMKTLTRWIKLLTKDRNLTIRKEQAKKRRTGGIQRITKFFKTSSEGGRVRKYPWAN